MNLKYQIKIGCLWTLSMTLLIGPTAWADTPALTSGSYSTNQPSSFTGTKGWAFVNSSVSPYMAITQLGVYDNNGDGLANSHDVGLWTADGTLLASATVPAGTAAPLVGGFRYMPISPVIIPIPTHIANPSTAFIVASEYSAGDADDLVTPIAGVADGVQPWIFGPPSSGRFGFGTGLPYPSFYTHGNVALETFGLPFFEASFQFSTIPEPSVPLLLAPGLIYLCLRRCK